MINFLNQKKSVKHTYTTILYGNHPAKTFGNK